ncbi:MAG: prolyl oligopeptidase family serine peptidase [Deltaproteobacteria bacterium]|nr:prolyl oligopeptidase family serine peptidase [Deltaproteobacteria bacterium]
MTRAAGLVALALVVLAPSGAGRAQPGAGGPSRLPACVTQAAGCGLDRPAWVESAAGFVTRWAVARVDGKLRKEKDPTALVRALIAESAMAERISAEAIVELAEDGKLERGQAAPVFALAARVRSPVAQEVALKLAVNSHATVAINGIVVHDEDGDQYMLADHRRVDVRLVEGWNDVAIRLEKTPPHAARVMLRLRATSGLPVEGLLWDLPREVAAASPPDPCAALVASVTPSVAAEGWTVSGRVRVEGLVPFPFPARWSIHRDHATLADQAIDPAALATRELTLDGALPADVGPGELALRVGTSLCASERHAADAEVRRRLLVAEDHIEGLDDKTLGWAGRESLRFQADEIRKMLSYPKRQRAARRLAPALAALESAIADARAGRPPFAEPGVHVRAYRSELDGSLQRYVVAVPRGYAKGKDPVPLVVLSHGLAYTPEDMLRIAFAKPAGPKEAWASGVIHGWDPPSLPTGALVVAHDGYGNAGQRPPGEHDVLRVIDEMQAAYRVDPRRVSISGFSLGGSVAFWVPFHQPDRFAAAAPLCGYPNLLEQRSVKAAKKRPWEPRLLDEEGVAPYAEGGRYLPLKMVHGAQDNPRRSRLIEDRYKALRYQVELEVPPLGHNVWDHAFEDGKLLRWLSSRKRPAVAPQPVVRSGRYRWAKAYWLRVDRFQDEESFGELSGRFQGERLEVATRNVAALTLIGDELGERALRPQTLVIDGRPLGEHVVGEALHLSKAGGAWAVVEAIDRPEDHKRAGVEGPLGDVWYGPQLVVYGTQDPAQVEANRLTAERLAYHSPWIDLRVPVKADVDVTDDDLIGRSLVLVGNPTTNRLTRRVEADLAKAGLRFEAGAIVLGARRFAGEDVGVSLIRPSPFDPNRYLVVHAGVGIEGTLSARYLPDLAPDFLVYDSRMRAVFGDKILGPREALYGGFFDARWRLPEDGGPPDVARPRGGP